MESVNISIENYNLLKNKERKLKKLKRKVREGFKYCTLIKDGDEKMTFWTNDEEVNHLTRELKTVMSELDEEVANNQKNLQMARL